MNNEQRIDVTVAQLEELLPEFQAFGRLLEEDYRKIETKTFSHRHSDGIHALGLICFPHGSNEFDEKCVSLIISIIDRKYLSISGYVVVNSPPYSNEVETRIFRNPSQHALQQALPEIRSLLGPFQEGVQRELSTKPNKSW